MTDLYQQLLVALERTTHFQAMGDHQMFVFWSRVYNYLLRKLNGEAK